MSTKEELAMTKWNGSVPQIHVPDITMPVMEHHMSAGVATMSIALIIIMFMVSFGFWHSCFTSSVRLHRAVYALAGLMSSFVAGHLIWLTVTNW